MTRLFFYFFLPSFSRLSLAMMEHYLEGVHAYMHVYLHNCSKKI